MAEAVAKEAVRLPGDPRLRNQRKRKRLNAVLDKISNARSVKSSYGTENTVVDSNGNNADDDDKELSDNRDICSMFGGTEQNKNFGAKPKDTSIGPGLPKPKREEKASPPPDDRQHQLQQKMSKISFRRELWRDHGELPPRQTIDDLPISFLFNIGSTPVTQDLSTPHPVFKFDSFDRDRFPLKSTSCDDKPNVAAASQFYFGMSAASAASAVAAGHDVDASGGEFSPMSGIRSPHSSLSSPQVGVDSPRICFSPLKIKESIEEEDETGRSIHRIPRLNIRGCESESATSLLHYPFMAKSAHLEIPIQASFDSKFLSTSLIRPISPNLPLTPTTPNSHLSTISNYPAYLKPDLVADWDERLGRQQRGRPRQSPFQVMPTKRDSLDSEAPTTPQDSPLDLSVRGTGLSLSPGIETSVRTSEIPAKKKSGRGRGRSRSTTNRGGSRISVDHPEAVREPTESTTPSGESIFVCPICGQMFAVADRLSKHMASRHKTRLSEVVGSHGTSGSQQQVAGSRLPHVCDLCNRTFARSDMLTRHMRLHTGIKPYTCLICGQIFSRSDHLSTHQRTHTGEKPYQCPTCPYAACRRDMITRHMRTHARYEVQDPSTTLKEVNPVLPKSKDENE